MPITKSTTSHEALKLACYFFNESDSDFSLYLVTVSDPTQNLVKQSRLPDQLCDLTSRQTLAARFYIKGLSETEQLLPDELVHEVARDSQYSLLDLNTKILADEVMKRDYQMFKNVPYTNYIEALIDKDKSSEELLEFENLNNSELFWVAWAILQESKPDRRAKVIKFFLQMAMEFRLRNNLNSLFNIVFGLGHSSVKRLKKTWEYVPQKWIKQFKDFEDLHNPTRNMSRYRSLLTECLKNPPVIPFYPILKKDLMFIQIGNNTKVDNLVNFEKMRMLAKEIRGIKNMSNPESFIKNELTGSLGPSVDSLMPSSDRSTGTLNRLHQKTKSNVSGISAESMPLQSSSTMKKIYDDQLMLRKVKFYLKNLEKTMVTEEQALIKLSEELEPSDTNSEQIRRRGNPNHDTISIRSNQSLTSNDHSQIGFKHNKQDSEPVLMTKSQTLSLSTPPTKHFGKYKNKKYESRSASKDGGL